MQKELQKYISENRYLFWDLSENSLQNLSKKSILERTLNYADMKEFRQLLKILGNSTSRELFNDIINQERVNLSPKLINFFSLYFAKHLS